MLGRSKRVSPRRAVGHPALDRRRQPDSLAKHKTALNVPLHRLPFWSTKTPSREASAFTNMGAACGVMTSQPDAGATMALASPVDPRVHAGRAAAAVRKVQASD